MRTIQLKDRQFELFIPEKTILGEIDRIAQSINNDLHDKEPLFIVVLNGAFMFASDLVGKFSHPCEVTFIRLKSYQGTGREENVKLIQGLVEEVKDRHVVIVEDIIDTGHTMGQLMKLIEKENPASVRIATLLFKPNALQLKDINPDYVALEIPNDFIVGYGLDYDGHGRNLREIYKVKE